MADAATTCPVEQQLADYGLGKLADEEVLAVSAHLEVCPRCRARVASQPPDSFVGRLLAAARPEGATPMPAALADAAAPEDLPPALAASAKYRVLGKLGQGGMGAVWKATHTVRGQPVAIKVMAAAAIGHAEARRRFLTEIQAVFQLDHPHIVRALDAEEVGDVLILVMECVEGVNLDRLVSQEGPLPVWLACRCAMQAALGLHHAHERGLIHRDIKPANLMVTAQGGAVKILDFGLARRPDDAAGAPGQTRSETFLGTPEYVAPEQAADARSATAAADVYSLGCTLYHLLAGRPPFQDGSVLETLTAHARDEPRPVTELRPEVPAALWAVLARMLAKDPKERYPTAAEVARALKPFAAPPTEGNEPAAPAEPAEGAKPMRRRRRVLRVALIAAVLAVASAVAPWLSWPRGGVITNSIGMKLAPIPAGEFVMGSPEAEVGRKEWEGPQHTVRITRPFYMGVYEVTQREYEAVMGDNPSWLKHPDHPAERVLWAEAVEFCKKLSALPPEKKAGRRYRLPTEAEWEYACRAGSTTAFSTGDILLRKQANFGDEHFRSEKVGNFAPNAWGLHDMHGNVLEWVSDWHDANSYAVSPRDDPQGPAKGTRRVTRGGSWFTPARDCRSAFRESSDPIDFRDATVGFRVVVESP